MKKFIFVLLFIISNAYSQTAYDRQYLERLIKPNKTKTNGYLFINPIKQQARQCQSTCTSMILAYSGINISPNDIEIITNGQTNAAPPMSHIVNSLLNKFKIPLKMSRYEVKYGSPEVIVEFLKELVDNNRPSYFLAYYHALVVQGYDETSKTIYCTDPNRPNNVIVFRYFEFANFIRNSPEYRQTQKIFIAHINTPLINFFYLPKAPREQSETFIYKGALR